MAAILQFLDQIRPAGTSPVNLFSPQKSQQVVLKTIWIANNSNANREYSLYFANDGAAASIANAIAYQVQIDGKTSVRIDLEIPMRNSNGIFYIQTSNADDITFTLFGER